MVWVIQEGSLNQVVIVMKREGQRFKKYVGSNLNTIVIVNLGLIFFEFNFICQYIFLFKDNIVNY